MSEQNDHLLAVPTSSHARTFRHCSVIVKMILSTDMSVHGSKLTSFNAKVESQQLDLTHEDNQVRFNSGCSAAQPCDM